MELAIILFTWLVVWMATEGSKKRREAAKRERERKAWKEDMTDIDPITGDYTSKSDGMRYDKYGVLKWRDDSIFPKK